MMRLSKTVDYMVRCVLFLATHEPGTTVDRRAIVEATGVPDLFFRKIVQQLSRAGIVRVTRGPKGQYGLAVSAEELTLLRVVEVGDGEICLNECAMNPGACSRSRACPVHPVWHDLRDNVRDALGAVTFAALASPGSRDAKGSGRRTGAARTVPQRPTDTGRRGATA
ncbi:MAG: hypothetical protein A3K19_28815 [Lentisphaerae bacterium RIFOXYB12_FULL_65_16]|nr:MAG: hypothetical protein A3K18_25400 [Lentisphaerae bacterium RIFOXYA12_64_32]OGV88296.1 MAG: hypothetical protein A3K19_28815 [Lentisphaerae bacterium RIFOXYB12_FULL_65_16]